MSSADPSIQQLREEINALLGLVMLVGVARVLYSLGKKAGERDLLRGLERAQRTYQLTRER